MKNLASRIYMHWLAWALHDLQWRDPLNPDIPHLIGRIAHLEQTSKPVRVSDVFWWAMCAVLFASWGAWLTLTVRACTAN